MQHAHLCRDETLSRRKPIELRDRQRVLELADQGLSARQIAQRMGISVETAQQTLSKGITHCDQCGRPIGRGYRCPVCTLVCEAELSERLKAFRTAAALSQLQLALNAGVSAARVRHWESGQKQPTEYELEMLAEALGLTVQQLTGIARSGEGG
jgi:transcriptional regulator with XRE-family HTH domain